MGGLMGGEGGKRTHYPRDIKTQFVEGFRVGLGELEAKEVVLLFGREVGVGFARVVGEVGLGVGD